jgi:hypothetical protein
MACVLRAVGLEGEHVVAGGRERERPGPSHHRLAREHAVMGHDGVVDQRLHHRQVRCRRHGHQVVLERPVLRARVSSSG